jgi:hypothetical protein
MSRALVMLFVAGLLAGWTVALSIFVSFGLPTSDRLRVVLSGHELSAEEREAVDTQRQVFFQAVEQDRVTLAADRDGPVLLPAFEMFSKQPDAGTRVEGDVVIALLRLTVVRGLYDDESLTLSALSRMEPRKFDFDPKSYFYGGAYLYSVGATIFGLASVGLIDLRSGIAAYIDDPSGIAKMYEAARGVNAAAFLILILLVFDFVRRLKSQLAAVFSVAAVACSPGLWQYAFVAKPHMFAAMWAMVCIYCLFRYVEQGPRKSNRLWLIGTALGGGMAAGAAFGQGLAAATTFSVFLIAGRGRWTARPMLLASAGTLFIFFAVNPYYILSFQQFLLDLRLGGTEYDRNGIKYEAFWPFVAAIVRGIGPGAFLLAAVGFIATALERDSMRRGLLAVLGITVLIGGTVFSELRLLLYAVPLICVFTGIGGAFLIRAIPGRYRAVVGGLVTAAVAAPGIAVLFFSLATTSATQTAIADYQSWSTQFLESPTTIGLTGFPPPVDFFPPLFAHQLVDIRPAAIARLGQDDPRRIPEFVYQFGAPEYGEILNGGYDPVFEAQGPVAPDWFPKVVAYPAVDWRLAFSIWRRTPP